MLVIEQGSDLTQDEYSDEGDLTSDEDEELNIVLPKCQVLQNTIKETVIEVIKGQQVTIANAAGDDHGLGDGHNGLSPSTIATNI